MTIGLVIKCKGGIVVASDSLSVWMNSSASKYVNKIRVIQSDYLQHPVVVTGAGTGAFIDKFIDRCQRKIELYCRGQRQERNDSEYRLDVVDFAEGLGEIVVSELYLEYVNQRVKALDIRELYGAYSLSLLVSGATHGGELRAFCIHQEGLSENIESYHTIGSGSSYAEFFLRDLSSEESCLSIMEACNLALHAVKAAEIMDRNVGGMAKIKILELKNTAVGKPYLSVSNFPHDEGRDRQALDEMIFLIRETGSRMRQVVKEQSFGNETQLQAEVS